MAFQAMLDENRPDLLLEEFDPFRLRGHGAKPQARGE
jgi:hypothetical protein